jgi:hypothetical protein
MWFFVPRHLRVFSTWYHVPGHFGQHRCLQHLEVLPPPLRRRGPWSTGRIHCWPTSERAAACPRGRPGPLRREGTGPGTAAAWDALSLHVSNGGLGDGCTFDGSAAVLSTAINTCWPCKLRCKSLCKPDIHAICVERSFNLARRSGAAML